LYADQLHAHQSPYSVHDSLMYENIQQQLSKDNDEQVGAYLEASILKIDELLSKGELDKELFNQSVADIQTESVCDQLYRLKSLYPFVELFSYGEFLIFASVVDAHLASKAKAKRGRPKKDDADEAQLMVRQVGWIQEHYPGARFNMLTRKREYLRDGEWYTMQGNDLDMIYVDLGVKHSLNIQPKRAHDIFLHVSDANPYEPTLELMEYCRKQCPHMTKAQAEELLFSAGSRLLGVKEGEPKSDGLYIRDKFFARFMLNMALLARTPGLTPTWIPILIGEQGCGKSQFCRSLIPEKHSFLFTPITNTLEQLAKEQYRMHVAFLLELPEIDSLMSGKKATEWMKNLITTTDDEVRYCYQPLPTKITRRFSFIGTTNREDLFRDSSGCFERRYIPIQIPSGFKIPWEEMKEGLSTQLWAAADLLAEDYQDDDSVLKSFSDEEMTIISEYQQSYTAVDPWEARLMSFIQMRQEFTPSEALTYVDVPIAQQNRAHIRRINGLIRKCLGERARYMQVNRNGERPWIWRVKDEPALEKQMRQSLSEVKASDF